MSEEKSFFKKATRNSVGVGEIFSEVFRHHTPEENARLFMAGTALTTPDEKKMLSQWTKPYMFARIFLVGLALFLGSTFLTVSGLSVTLPITFVLGSFLVPVTVMFFCWEMNIPRNISFSSVLLIFLAGGFLSLVFTFMFDSFLVAMTSPVLYYIGVGVVEELAKVLAGSIWLRGKDKKYILTGMLVGAAVGAGFAGIESLGYSIVNTGWSYENILMRAALAIGTHVSWAMISCGALVWAKGEEELSFRHYLSPRFLGGFLLVIALHACWDVMGSVPIAVLLCILAVIAGFYMLRKGLNQVVSVAVVDNYGSLTKALEPEEEIPAPVQDGWKSGAPAAVGDIRIQGTSGYFAGRRFPLEDCVRLGRATSGNNLVFPANCAGISRNHCEMMFRNGHIYVKDLDSTYGTFVNGQKLNPEQVFEVQPGDKIWLGSSKEEFLIDRKRM